MGETVDTYDGEFRSVYQGVNYLKHDQVAIIHSWPVLMLPVIIESAVPILLSWILCLVINLMVTSLPVIGFLLENTKNHLD